MKKYLWVLVYSLLLMVASAQKPKQASISLFNTNTTFPFSTIGKLFASPVHPGIELGYGFNWKTHKQHDWYQSFKLGYFYHRFAQHGIPLYTTFGYRYKFSQRIKAHVGLGTGYLLSIPATAKLKLNSAGTYENNKGAGRSQVIANVDFGISYLINARAKKPVELFTTLQQRLQFPFVKSYVPILPYQSIFLGASMPIKNLF